MIGAIAGIAGTIAMTAAMRRLHHLVPPRDQGEDIGRVPDDPAEPTTDRKSNNDAGGDVSDISQFGYGALAGSIIAAANPRLGPLAGAASGVAMWAAGYLGGGKFRTGAAKPRPRNGRSLVARVVWGVATARAMRELLAARETITKLTGGDRDPDSVGNEMNAAGTRRHERHP